MELKDKIVAAKWELGNSTPVCYYCGSANMGADYTVSGFKLKYKGYCNQCEDWSPVVKDEDHIEHKCPDCLYDWKECECVDSLKP